MSNVSNPIRPNQGQGSQPRSGNSGSNQGHGSGSGVMEKASEGAAAISERVSDAASFISDKAKAATSSVMHSAEDAASYVGKKTDDGIHAVGSGLKSLGDSVRHTAPERDMLKDGVCAVADTLENTGKYLEGGPRQHGRGPDRTHQAEPRCFALRGDRRRLPAGPGPHSSQLRFLEAATVQVRLGF